MSAQEIPAGATAGTTVTTTSALLFFMAFCQSCVTGTGTPGIYLQQVGEVGKTREFNKFYMQPKVGTEGFPFFPSWRNKRVHEWQTAQVLG